MSTVGAHTKGEICPHRSTPRPPPGNQSLLPHSTEAPRHSGRRCAPSPCACTSMRESSSHHSSRSQRSPGFSTPTPRNSNNGSTLTSCALNNKGIGFRSACKSKQPKKPTRKAPSTRSVSAAPKTAPESSSRSTLEESVRSSVFVDPYTGEVLGTLEVYGNSGALPVRTWISMLHRHLHLGEVGRLYSELAASWLWVVASGALSCG